LTLGCAILAGVLGCQSALYNTYPVPGENAGKGLKYYRDVFPRGQKPDLWEGQKQTTVEPEPRENAQEKATTDSTKNTR
jgi:hypothetical protein